MNEFTVDASIEKLGDVLDFINAQLERNNCRPELQNQIDVAVEEIFVNIAHYAYKSVCDIKMSSVSPANGKASMTVAVGKNIVIKFEDSGFPYNPLEHADPDLDKPVMEREIGGLGIFLTKKIMDKIEYARIDNKNILTMTKKLTI